MSDLKYRSLNELLDSKENSIDYIYKLDNRIKELDSQNDFLRDEIIVNTKNIGELTGKRNNANTRLWWIEYYIDKKETPG